MNRKHLIGINLILENVEHIKIEAMDIKYILATNIVKSLQLNRSTRTVFTQDTAREFTLILDKDLATEEYNSWGNNIKIFDRLLQYKDIVAIELSYSDSIDTLYLLYEGDQENKLQRTWIDERGDLHITVNTSEEENE